jgi:ABC-type spermidine/putrescine transport system permease subunit I
MNVFIVNILIYCIVPFTAILIIVAINSKIILKKNGYKVEYLWMSFYKDIKNMNKLSKEKTDLRVLYYSLLISTIGFLSLLLLAFIVIISEIISRS